MLLFQTETNVELNDDIQVKVKVVTEEGDGVYISTEEQFTINYFLREAQLYLWYISHNRSLIGFRDNIQEYLEENGHDRDKENRISPYYYKNDAEFFAERVDERMGDVLDLKNASDFACTLYGHTVLDIEVKLINNVTNEEVLYTSKEYDKITERKVLNEITSYIVH